MKILLVVAVVVASSAAQQCPNNDCQYPEGCSSDIQPNNSGYNISQSPFFDVVIDSGYLHDYIDSSCWTYFPMQGRNYDVSLQVHTVVLCNGTLYIRVYVAAAVDSNLGIYRSTGLFENTTSGCDSCTFNDYYLAQPSSHVYVLRRCNFNGQCVQDFGKPYVYNAISSSPNISDATYNAILAYNFTNPVRVPYKNTPKCVTSLGPGVNALNWQRVSCEGRVTFPIGA